MANFSPAEIKKKKKTGVNRILISARAEKYPWACSVIVFPTKQDGGFSGIKEIKSVENRIRCLAKFKFITNHIAFRRTRPACGWLHFICR